MATKPTREQQQAADLLAEALFQVGQAARLDGRASLARDDFRELAARLARASSAFSLDELVVRALARRGSALGLAANAAELLTLLDAEVRPLDMLMLDDGAFRDLVARLEDELGEI